MGRFPHAPRGQARNSLSASCIPSRCPSLTRSLALRAASPPRPRCAHAFTHPSRCCRARCPHTAPYTPCRRCSCRPTRTTSTSVPVSWGSECAAGAGGPSSGKGCGGGCGVSGSESGCVMRARGRASACCSSFRSRTSSGKWMAGRACRRRRGWGWVLAGSDALRCASYILCSSLGARMGLGCVVGYGIWNWDRVSVFVGSRYTAGLVRDRPRGLCRAVEAVGSFPKTL